MRLIIDDTRYIEERKAFYEDSKDTITIFDDGTIKSCIGCFECWTKTPGTCVIRDNYCNMGELISKSEEMIIISRCLYGGFSPFVKNVLDRSISYVHPYFEIRKGEMHHKRRYDNLLSLKVVFYGDVSEAEKSTAEKLVKANAINLDCKDFHIEFAKDLVEARKIAEGGMLL